MRETLYPSFHPREILPAVGDICYGNGFAGTYRIRVREVLGQRILQDGYVQLKIRGERELIEPRFPERHEQLEDIPMDDETFRTECSELANAIETGAGQTWKITGRFFQLASNQPRPPGTGTIIGTCAIGAALLAQQGTRDYAQLQRVNIFSLFPVLRETMQWPEGIVAEPCWLSDMIYGLNDGLHGEPWTREEIAVWLRTARRVPVAKKTTATVPPNSSA